MEVWKDVLDYEGDYEVSNIGDVKSLKYGREKILKPSFDSDGYPIVNLSKNNKSKVFKIHKLVAVAFLGNNQDGMTKKVVDHIDFNKLNNQLSNLQLITTRENLSKDKFRGNYSSRLVGVHWSKNANKWRACIYTNGKQKHLGYFDSEIEASKAYQKALNKLP